MNAAFTMSTTGCEMDYFIKLSLLYICFLSKILPRSDIWERLRFSFIGPLNFGFPAFRNVDVLLYLCASFWALMSFLQSETHSSYRVKQISGQQQPPSLSFIELSGGKKIWGICFNPETTAQLLSH